MIAVRQRTLRVLPRRAWRVIRTTMVPKQGNARVRDNRPGLFETFEKMLDSHAQLMFRNIER
jgi:hypothetical protein